MDYVEVTNVVKALIVARKGGMPIDELDSKFSNFFLQFIYFVLFKKINFPFSLFFIYYFIKNYYLFQIFICK